MRSRNRDMKLFNIEACDVIINNICHGYYRVAIIEMSSGTPWWRCGLVIGALRKLDHQPYLVYNT
jgi:hypothetical protein